MPKPARKKPTAPKASPTPRFVGRDGSPVLDRYPPKDPALSPKGPPSGGRSNPPTPQPSPPSRHETPGSAGTTSGSELAPPGPPGSLIRLERPFDIDEFSQSLGESTILVEVPREELAEVLRRIADFMGFGIYVYSFRVRPAPEDSLKKFVIELQRVDYSSDRADWVPFEEKGRSDSPFGPTGGRR